MPRKKSEAPIETPVEAPVETPIEKPIVKSKSIAELQEMVNKFPYQWSNDFKVVKVDEVYCVTKEGQLIMWDKDVKKCEKIAKVFNMSAKKAMGNIYRSDATI